MYQTIRPEPQTNQVSDASTSLDGFKRLAPPTVSLPKKRKALKSNGASKNLLSRIMDRCGTQIQSPVATCSPSENVNGLSASRRIPAIANGQNQDLLVRSRRKVSLLSNALTLADSFKKASKSGRWSNSSRACPCTSDRSKSMYCL